MSIYNQIQQMKEFDRRWKIKTENIPSKVFSSFRRAILQVFSSIEDHMPDNSRETFAIAFDLDRSYRRRNYSSTSETTIISALENTDSPIDFYRMLEFIFSLRFEYDYWNHYCGKLIEILAFQPVDIEITKDRSNNLIIIPKGEELLDEEIVNKALSFLDDKSNSHFIDALKEYQVNKSASHIKSCEQLRRTIEEFLRAKLENTKNLNNNISELLKKLEEHGVNKEIRNLVQKDIDYLDKYFNENSKHGDGEIGEAENEFLIYQVGLLLRLVDEALK